MSSTNNCVSLNSTYSFKIVLLGNPTVGKSSLMLRYTENKFIESLQNTIGVDFKQKKIERKGKQITLQVWDTGQERFNSLARTFYSNADAVMYVFDVTSNESLNTILNHWRPTFQNNINREKFYEIIIGNKIDKVDGKPSQYILNTLSDTQIDFMFTSAKTSDKVDEAFEKICDELLKMREIDSIESAPMTNSFFLRADVPTVDISGNSYCSYCSYGSAPRTSDAEEDSKWFAGLW